MLLGRGGRRDHIERGLDDVFDRRRFELEPQLAADDPGHVEQVFDQPQL